MSQQLYSGDNHIFYTESGSSNVYLSAPPGQNLIIQGNTATLPALGSGHIFVGNGSNIAADQPMSGDATIDNTGVLSLASTGTAGSYSVPMTITTDSKGRVTSVSDYLAAGHIIIGNNSNLSSAVNVTGDISIDQYGNATLVGSGVSAGTYGSSSSIPILTIDSKGRCTSASTIGTSLLSLFLPSGDILLGDAYNYSHAVSMTGDITISNTGVTSLNSTGVTAATYGSTTQVPTFTTDVKGRIISASNTTFSIPGSVALTNGKFWIGVGGGAAESSYTLPVSIGTNQLLYSTGSTTVTGLASSPNSILVSGSGGAPFWNGSLPLSVSTTIYAVGTITSGIWNSNIINSTYGGTGVNNTGNTLSYSNNISFSSSGPVSLTLPLSGTLLTNALTSGSLFIGNSSGVATATTITGDATISSSGVLTLSTVATAGTSIPTSLTINAKGLVTSISNSLTAGNIITGNTVNNAFSFAVSGDLSMLYGAFTLNTVNGGVGTFGTSTATPQITVNAKGLITAISSTTHSGVGLALTTNKIWIGNSSLSAESAFTLPASTTINNLLYSSAANTIGNLTTQNNGVLVTNGSGVPSIGTAITTSWGSAAAPTYSFSNSTSTGIYSSLTGLCDISAGGVQVLSTYSGAGGCSQVNIGRSAYTGSPISSGGDYLQLRSDCYNNGSTLVGRNGLTLYHSVGFVGGSSVPLHIAFNNNLGATVGMIYQNSTSTVTYSTTSDYRLKTNVQNITNGLDTINQIRPVTFNWTGCNTPDSGFLSHEVQAVIPQAVIGAKDAVDSTTGKIIPQMLDETALITYLVAAVKELAARIVILEAGA